MEEEQKKAAFIDIALLRDLDRRIEEALNQANATIDQLQKDLNRVTTQRAALNGQKSLVQDLLKQIN